MVKNMTFSVEDCLSTFILHFIGHLEMTEASESTYDMIAPGPGDGDMFAMFPGLYSARCPAAVENSLMCDRMSVSGLKSVKHSCY